MSDEIVVEGRIARALRGKRGAVVANWHSKQDVEAMARIASREYNDVEKVPRVAKKLVLRGLADEERKGETKI